MKMELTNEELLTMKKVIRENERIKLIEEVEKMIDEREKNIIQINCDKDCVGNIWDIEFGKLKQQLQKLKEEK